MPTYQWNDSFVTDLSAVDDQHYHLVELVNQFSEWLDSDEFKLEGCGQLIEELASYTVYHFEEEEALMVVVGVDPRHTQAHVQAHRSFIQEVQRLSAPEIVESKPAAEHLLEFLAHWLIDHILVSDQSMARQIKAIRAGMSSDEAYMELEQQ